MGQMSDRQLTVGQLIRALERLDAGKSIKFDFVNFKPAGLGSYRGYYEDLAIRYRDAGAPTVGDLLGWLKDQSGNLMDGYHGGQYRVTDQTAIWVANASETGGTAVVDVVDDGWCVVLKTDSVD